jgi:hypothetical protein
MSTADAIRFLTEQARGDAFIRRQRSREGIEDLLRSHAKTLYHTMKKLTPATIAAAVAAYEKTHAEAFAVAKPLPRIGGPVVVAFKNEGRSTVRRSDRQLLSMSRHSMLDAASSGSRLHQIRSRRCALSALRSPANTTSASARNAKRVRVPSGTKRRS